MSHRCGFHDLTTCKLTPAQRDETTVLW